MMHDWLSPLKRHEPHGWTVHEISPVHGATSMYRPWWAKGIAHTRRTHST